MKRTSFVGLLSATFLVSAAAPSLSEVSGSNPMPGARPLVRDMAQSDGSGARADDGELLLLAQADLEGEEPGIGSPYHIGPADIEHGPRVPALRLAAKLAAVETYVGIRADQLDAWRAYSAALIELVDRPQRERDQNGPRRHFPDGHRGDRADGPASFDGPQQVSADVPLFVEQLADSAIDRGEKGNKLKTTVAALRATLTSGQLTRLREAEPSLLPSPGPLVPGGPGAGWNNGHSGWPDDVPPPPPLPPMLAE